MEQERQSISFKDIISPIFKHKGKVWFVFFATVITVTVASFMASPVYESQTTLMIKLGRENVYRPEVGDSAGVFSTSENNMDKMLNTELKILGSQDLMQRLVESIGVENLYPKMIIPPQKGMIQILMEIPWLKNLTSNLVTNPKEAETPLQSAVREFKSKLSVGIAINSNVIEVGFQHEDPKLVAGALNLLIQLFKEKHIEVFRSSLSSLFDKQQEYYYKKMVDSEAKLEGFKKKNKIFSHAEQSSLLLRQRMGLETSLLDTQNEIGELKQRVDSLNNQILTIPENETIQLSAEATRYGIIDGAKANLLDLKRKESEFARKYKNFRAGSQILASVRDEIKIVTKFLREQQKSLRDNVGTSQTYLYQQVKLDLIKARADLKALYAKEGNVRKQLKKLDEDMIFFDQNGMEFKMLLRSLTANQTNYETYLAKLEEANISGLMDELKMDNISVIQKAIVPSNPIKPNKKLNIIMSLFLGAFSGIGLAFFTEFIGHGFSTPEQVEKRLGLPVISTVLYKG